MTELCVKCNKQLPNYRGQTECMSCFLDELAHEMLEREHENFLQSLLNYNDETFLS